MQILVGQGLVKKEAAPVVTPSKVASVEEGVLPVMRPTTPVWHNSGLPAAAVERRTAGDRYYQDTQETFRVSAPLNNPCLCSQV